MHDYRKHVHFSKHQLYERYAEVLTDLANLHEEHSFVKTQELRTEVESFMRSTADSIAAKTRDAKWHTLDHAAGLITLEGQIAALTEERRLLEMLLDHGKHRP